MKSEIASAIKLLYNSATSSIAPDSDVVLNVPHYVFVSTKLARDFVNVFEGAIILRY